MNVVDRTSSTASDGIGRKPHVALVFRQLRASGGAEKMAGLLLDVFRAYDLRLTVVARNCAGTPDGFEFRRVDPPHLGRVGRIAGFARAACRALRDADADLVLSQEAVPCCNVYRTADGVHAEWMRWRHRVHGPLKRFWDFADPYQRTKLRLERATFESENLRAVICNSGMVRDEILRHYRVDPERLHVIENAVDPEIYRRPSDAGSHRRQVRGELDIPDSATLWLFVGSGFHRKGLDSALRALARAPDGHYLAVVGRDHRLRRYRRLAARLGIAERVRFAGRKTDVRPYYWAADALIHPALYEPYGLVVLEAMAAGLPVLGSRQCGAANALIRHGENGYRYDALDVEGWAGAMARIESEVDRAAFSKAAVAAAGERSLQRLQSEVTSLCDDLLDRL